MSASLFNLSDRERDCLSWASLGKSSWEIGRIFSISEHTAVFHIKNAMRKLGTSNRVLAVAKAKGSAR
jgi:LuxR family quorum-sensing system transcriptional regulator CciR